METAMTQWDDDDDLDLAIKEGEQYLLFYSKETLFAISSSHITEIVEYPAITKVPMTHEAILGVANIRGSIVGIIDLSVLLWKQATLLTPRTSVIIIQTQNEGEKVNIGLLVDEIFEVDNLPESDIIVRPPFGLTIDKKYIASISPYKNEYLMLLNMENILDIETLSEGEIVQ
jgi:purine-binding chemotaxis protein CheW